MKEKEGGRRENRKLRWQNHLGLRNRRWFVKEDGGRSEKEEKDRRRGEESGAKMAESAQKLIGGSGSRGSEARVTNSRVSRLACNSLDLATSTSVRVQKRVQHTQGKHSQSNGQRYPCPG